MPKLADDYNPSHYTTVSFRPGLARRMLPLELDGVLKRGYRIRPTPPLFEKEISGSGRGGVTPFHLKGGLLEVAPHFSQDCVCLEFKGTGLPSLYVLWGSQIAEISRSAHSRPLLIPISPENARFLATECVPPGFAFVPGALERLVLRMRQASFTNTNSISGAHLSFPLFISRSVEELHPDIPVGLFNAVSDLQGSFFHVFVDPGELKNLFIPNFFLRIGAKIFVSVPRGYAEDNSEYVFRAIVSRNQSRDELVFNCFPGFDIQGDLFIQPYNHNEPRRYFGIVFDFERNRYATA